MRLAEMVAREDFYNILADTVTEYYRLVHNRDVTFSYEKNINSEKLIVNGKLGFISRFPAGNGLRRFLLAEYNVRGNKLKFLAGKAAALLFSAFPQVGKLRNAYITRDALGKGVFISPQNRSVRFFDYDAMTVDCIIKSGFTSKYFTNQLAFRKQYHYDFMLPLLDSGDKWFREPILVGHPLARVTNETQYQKSMQDALTYIGQLAADTTAYEDSGVYAQQLMQKIQVLVAEATERKHITYGPQTLQMAEKAVQTVQAHPMQIPTCISHGDFQGGNIWVDQAGKTWLYDWETAGRRSVWYDRAVLCYSLRRAYGWQMLWEENAPKDLCVGDFSTENAEVFAAVKAILLLEDFIFYLEDMLELPEDWGAEIFDSYAARMWELLKNS